MGVKQYAIGNWQKKSPNPRNPRLNDFSRAGV